MSLECLYPVFVYILVGCDEFEGERRKHGHIYIYIFVAGIHQSKKEGKGVKITWRMRRLTWARNILRI